MIVFTKTGSGLTYGKHSKREAFFWWYFREALAEKEGREPTSEEPSSYWCAACHSFLSAISSLFECCLCVCHEPVLVKRSLFGSIHAAQKMRFACTGWSYSVSLLFLFVLFLELLQVRSADRLIQGAARLGNIAPSRATALPDLLRGAQNAPLFLNVSHACPEPVLAICSF